MIKYLRARVSVHTTFMILLNLFTSSATAFDTSSLDLSNVPPLNTGLLRQERKKRDLEHDKKI